MLKTTILGRVGIDAVSKKIEDNKFVIEFSVASTERWTDRNGEKQERTTWVKAVKWAKTDNIAKYILKGDLIYLEGRISSEHWIKNEEAKSQLVLLVDRLEFASSANKFDNNTPPTVVAGEEDLPF